MDIYVFLICKGGYKVYQQIKILEMYVDEIHKSPFWNMIKESMVEIS